MAFSPLGVFSSVSYPLDVGRPWVMQDYLVSRALITSARTLFPKKVTFTGSEGEDMEIPWATMQATTAYRIHPKTAHDRTSTAFISFHFPGKLLSQDFL